MIYYGISKDRKAIIPFVTCIHVWVGKGYWNMEILIVEAYEPENTASHEARLH